MILSGSVEFKRCHANQTKLRRALLRSNKAKQADRNAALFDDGGSNLRAQAGASGLNACQVYPITGMSSASSSCDENGLSPDLVRLEKQWRFDRWLSGLLFGSTVGEKSQIGL
jgi:hypothetical protein